jgi:hypothetical protein
MRIARWIPKATNTHSEYAIFIAFPLQQWLHERVLMLRYTYIPPIVQSTEHSHVTVRLRDQQYSGALPSLRMLYSTPR